MKRRDFQLEMIVIGGSAGGLVALREIIAQLPEDFSIPITVVLHLPPGNSRLLPEVIGSWTKIRVVEPEDKSPIERRHIYTAPSGYHLMVEEERTFCVNLDDPIQFSMPSIDVFFTSVADVYGAQALAIVLSGANEDGAKGLRSIVEEGGSAIVQKPSSAQSSLMPEEALKEVPGAMILNPREIGEFLAKVQD